MEPAFLLRGFEFGFNFLHTRLDVIRADVFRINFPQRGMVLDGFIEKRLGDGWIIDFAVAVTAITDHVHHNITAELVTIFEGHAAHAQDSIHVFGIYVKNGNILAAGNLSGETRGVQFIGRCSEADQIIDDDMDGAANRIAGQVGVIQRLREDALARESAITMHQQRKVLPDAIFTSTFLLGASAANGDRIHSFQVAGIRNQMDMDIGSGPGGIFTGRAHVVFHVAAAQHAAGINIFEAGEDFFRRALGNVHDDVQTTAMTHPHDQFDGALLAGGFEDFINQRNKRGHTFQRKSLGTEIPLLQHLLE